MPLQAPSAEVQAKIAAFKSEQETKALERKAIKSTLDVEARETRTAIGTAQETKISGLIGKDNDFALNPEATERLAANLESFIRNSTPEEIEGMKSIYSVGHPTILAIDAQVEELKRGLNATLVNPALKAGWERRIKSLARMRSLLLSGG